jgi:valyl-tRNA synthetase
MVDDLDAQWHDALAGLTELALRAVTVVAMPPPDPTGRVRAGHGAMVTLTGVLGRMIEPEGRGRDVLQFPVGEPEAGRPVGGFSVSRPAFRGASRTESGWLAIQLDGLHLMIRPVPDADPDDATAAPGEPA